MNTVSGEKLIVSMTLPIILKSILFSERKMSYSDTDAELSGCQTSSISEDEETARRDVQDAFFNIQNEVDLIGTQVQDKQDIITNVAEEAKQQIIENKLREDAADKLKEKIENFDPESNTNQ